MNTSRIDTKRIKSTRIEVEYAGVQSGHIVLPVRYFPGWNANVNGKSTDIGQYLGTMPAIPVDGPSEIEFYYEPDWLTYAQLVSFAGLLLFLALMWPSLAKNVSREI